MSDTYKTPKPIVFKELPPREQWFLLDMVAVARSRHPQGMDESISDRAEQMMISLAGDGHRPDHETCKKLHKKYAGTDLGRRSQKAAEVHVIESLVAQKW